MFNISPYLKRFSGIINSEKLLKTSVVEAVFEIINYKISETAVSIKQNTAYFTVPAALKAEINLHQQEIINLIKKKNPTTPITSLR